MMILSSERSTCERFERGLVAILHQFRLGTSETNHCEKQRWLTGGGGGGEVNAIPPMIHWVFLSLVPLRRR